MVGKTDSRSTTASSFDAQASLANTPQLQGGGVPAVNSSAEIRGASGYSLYQLDHPFVFKRVAPILFMISQELHSNQPTNKH